MQEKELKFTHKRRTIDAPFCPCGEENNKKNPQFCPFEDTEGKYGYCHRCDRRFMPGDTKEVQYVYKEPERIPQKFVPEPTWNWILQDTLIDPVPDNQLALRGEFSVTFFFRNMAGQLCTAKKMQYYFPEFKRNKEKNPIYPFTRDSGYYTCLFYERDLQQFPTATVILVESEKTAAILRYKFKTHLHQYIYLAVSGSNGLTEDKIAPLKGRTILIVFDCDNGDLQEDGTIKNAKGREAAQSAYIKLSAIAHPTVIDIDPSNHDGLDLADLRHSIDIDYIRNLPTLSAGTLKIPDALLEDLRALNQSGEYLTTELINKLGQDHNINPDKISTLYRVVQKNFSADTGINKAGLIQRVEHWLGQHYDFRKNCITSHLQCRKKNTHEWLMCNPNDLWRDIHQNINAFGKRVKIPRSDIDNILDSSFVQKWNPFTDYFNSLPPWDNVDHIQLLSDHIRCEDQSFWRDQFKKALVRSIACTLDFIDNRIVMVLVGEKQSIGKSWFIRNLCPPELADEYYKETPLTHDKDSHIALTENFMWNLEELDDLTRKEISSLKATISTSKVKERRAYARYEISMKRIVNFWGSTNKSEFLTDTENTRWLCFTVLDISHDYNNRNTGIQNVDITKVWAQAYHLYKTKFSYHLSSEEKEYQAKQNRNFETMTDEKQLIMRYFRPARSGEALSKFMINIDIVESLIKNTNNSRIRIEPRNIGRAMSQLNFHQERKTIDGKTVRGYWVYPLDQPALFDTISVPEPVEESIDLPF